MCYLWEGRRINAPKVSWLNKPLTERLTHTQNLNTWVGTRAAWFQGLYRRLLSPLVVGEARDKLRAYVSPTEFPCFKSCGHDGGCAEAGSWVERLGCPLCFLMLRDAETKYWPWLNKHGSPQRLSKEEAASCWTPCVHYPRNCIGFCPYCVAAAIQLKEMLEYAEHECGEFDARNPEFASQEARQPPQASEISNDHEEGEASCPSSNSKG